MNHTEIFRQAIDALKPVNELLQMPEFLNSCADALQMKGIEYTVGASNRLVIPCDGPGIYMFWVELANWGGEDKPWNLLLSEFLDRWDKPEELITYFPKSNKKRSKLGDHCNNELIPFYLGKSEQLSNRIEQHIYLKPNKRTYALKLDHRVSLLRDVRFEINWLPLEANKSTYFLVAQVESLLREHFMPIIGKQ